MGSNYVRCTGHKAHPETILLQKAYQSTHREVELGLQFVHGLVALPTDVLAPSFLDHVNSINLGRGRDFDLCSSIIALLQTVCFSLGAKSLRNPKNGTQLGFEPRIF